MSPGGRGSELGVLVKSKGFSKDRFLQTLGGIKFGKNTRVTIGGGEFPLDAVPDAERIFGSTSRPDAQDSSRFSDAQDSSRFSVDQKDSVIVDPRHDKRRKPKYIDEIVSHQTGQTLRAPRDRSGSIPRSSGSNTRPPPYQTSRMNRFYQDMHHTT